MLYIILIVFCETNQMVHAKPVIFESILSVNVIYFVDVGLVLNML